MTSFMLLGEPSGQEACLIEVRLPTPRELPGAARGPAPERTTPPCADTTP